jgi:hypothetical protein
MSNPDDSRLLRHSVAEFERRVKRNIGLRGNSSRATLGELGVEARRLSRDCFAPVLEGLLRWRSQEVEGSPGMSVVGNLSTKGSRRGARRPLWEELHSSGAINQWC